MKNDDKYFESEEFQELLRDYEAMAESGQFRYLEAEELTDIAEYYAYNVGDEAAARKAIDLALQLHPDAVDPQIFIARSYLKDKDYDRAATVCAAIGDQEHREVIFLRAELMICRGQIRRALGYILSEADKIFEDLEYFFYDAAYIFIDYSCWDEAAALARELEEMEPDWYQTWELQADVLLARDSFAEALPYIEKMTDADTFNTETWCWKAEACSGLHDAEGAMESVDYALAIAPDDIRATQLKAWFLLQAGNAEAAHQYYLKLQKLDPDNPDSWTYDGQALLMMGDDQGVITVCQKAIDLHTDEMDSDALVVSNEYMAQAYSHRRMVSDALRCVDAAARFATTDEDVVDMEVMRMRVFLENDDRGRADEYAKRAVVVSNKARAYARFQVAATYYEYGYDEVALPIFALFTDGDAECVGADSEAFATMQAAAHTYRAACLDNLSRQEEALAELRKAVELKASNLEEIFSSRFPNGVRPEEYPVYFYYELYGHWPED